VVFLLLITYVDLTASIQNYFWTKWIFTNEIKCLILVINHRSDMSAGFPTLHCDAWNYGLDYTYSCDSNGRRTCTFYLTSEFFWWFIYQLAGAYLLIWSWCYREQGDAARVIQTLVFMSGINTLLQTMIGTRLPTVMGPSYAFVLPVLSIIRDYNDETFSKDHDVIIVKLT